MRQRIVLGERTPEQQLNTLRATEWYLNKRIAMQKAGYVAAKTKRKPLTLEENMEKLGKVKQQIADIVASRKQS